MKTPPGLQALIDDGVIDEVLRPLKSGKEAAVYVVRSGDDVRCAKVYKDMAQRSFKQRVAVPGGPQGARQPRGARHRQGQQVRPQAAGNRLEEHRGRRAVPVGRGRRARAASRYGYFHGVLVMELVTDADGLLRAAPGRGRADCRASAREYHAFLVQQVVRMLCIGLIHGDLSAYNVLVGAEGPVMIDFPQVVSAGGNNAARAMLLRDVNNLRRTLGRFAPELLETRVRRGDVGAVRSGELRPDSNSSRFGFVFRCFATPSIPGRSGVWSFSVAGVSSGAGFAGTSCFVAASVFAA